MRRPLLALLLAFLLALAAVAVAADGGGDGPRHRDGREGRDEDDRDEDGRDEDERDDEKDEDDRKGDGREERKERKEKPERRERPRPQPRAPEPPEPAAPAPAPVPPVPPPVHVALTGDAAVRQSVRNEPGRLTYLVAVGGLGPGEARDVTLSADLPDVAASWTLAGAGSEGCAVSPDLRLSCAWGDMGLGDVEVFQMTARLERAPAWQVRTVAALEAGNDRDGGNDVASSVVGILLT